MSIGKEREGEGERRGERRGGKGEREDGGRQGVGGGVEVTERGKGEEQTRRQKSE